MHRPFRSAPPALGPTAIVRPRLQDQLAQRFAVRLTTIEAGAGMGKTTVLAQAVDDSRLVKTVRDVWLTCEASDSTASGLLGSVLDALEAHWDGEPRVNTVCEAVWSLAPQEICLLFDDVHVVDPDAAGAATFGELVSDLPENGHVLLCGRRLPPIRRSRLVAQRRAVEIGVDELRFDVDEAVQFAATHRVPVDVVQQAGGWPALAELYARTGGSHVEQFVWEEVISPLPRRELDAFLRIVAVGGADADALEVVVGGPCDAGLLVTLPLVSSDGSGGVRPHALWTELLAGRINDDDAAMARRRLASALVDRSEYGAAFELLAATSDWDHALPVLFEACNDQRRPPWPDQMQRWRVLVPDATQEDPEVVYLDAMIERAGDSWSPDAVPLFARAIEGFRERGDLVQELTASVRFAYLAWLRTDLDTFDALHHRGVELARLGLPVEQILAFNRAVAADLTGHTDDVRARSREMSDLEPRLRHFPPLMRVFAQLADGAADVAVGDADAAAAAAQPVAPVAGTGWAALAPALVAWARGDLHRALEQAPTDPGAQFTVAERVPAIALGAIVRAHVGDSGAASRLVDDLDALVPELGDRDLLAGFRSAAAAAVGIARRDEAAARRALNAGLSGRALAPAGAGRALRWFPSLFFLFHDDAREQLTTMSSGPSRRHVLRTCEALLGSRVDSVDVPIELFDDPGRLLTILPAPLAVELVVRAAHGKPSAFHVGCIAGLADVAPATVRDTLRHFADQASERDVGAAGRALLETVPIPPQHRVRIEVFGATRLYRDGQLVDDADWRRQRVRQAMCALVAFPELRRERLGVLLWPEFDERSVSANLRMTLSYVQSLLEPGRAKRDAPWFLQQTAGVLRLRADDHLSIDAWEFDDELDAASAAADAGSPSNELHHLCCAVTLWRGEYLDDVAGEEWAQPLRERQRRRAARAATRAGELLLAGGRAEDAVRHAELAVAIDPWDEYALRLLITSLLATGDRRAAVLAFEAACHTLADLGVEPEEATAALGRKLTLGSR